MRIPKYRKASGRDLGCGEFDHHKQYFPGPYNSYESREAYRVWLRDVVLVELPPDEADGGQIYLVELVERFLDWAKDIFPTPKPQNEQ